MPDGFPDGFPSETLIRDGRLVFISLAAASGRQSQREAAWVEALGHVHAVEVHIFRPQQLRSVTRLLRGERGAASRVASTSRVPNPQAQNDDGRASMGDRRKAKQ